MVRKVFVGEVKNMRFGNYGRRNFFDLMEDGRCDAVRRTTYKMPDGSERTETEIKPSKSGALAGAAAGGAVGGPISAAVGAVFGFIFGPAD